MPKIIDFIQSPHHINVLRFLKLPLKSIYFYFKGHFLFNKYNQKTVTIYGSARLPQDDEWYIKTTALSKAIAEKGLAIMTGGGPGLMAAANYGAQQANNVSLGCCITTNNEEKNNDFLDVKLTCDYFFIRKVLLTKFSIAFVIAPGGYGTLDELFEMLNLIVTSKLKKHPVILFGTKYWQPLMTFITQSLLANNTISKTELDFITLTDDIDEICKIIKQQ